MDSTKAKEIPITCLPGLARKFLGNMLDPEDSFLRDYRQFGELLMQYNSLEVKALRANHNGVSITGVILDEAAKKGKSIWDLYDTLKRMDVAVLKDIEGAWQEIIDNYNNQRSSNRHAEEGYDSRSSICHCTTCTHNNNTCSGYLRPSNMSRENSYGMNETFASQTCLDPNATMCNVQEPFTPICLSNSSCDYLHCPVLNENCAGISIPMSGRFDTHQTSRKTLYENTTSIIYNRSLGPTNSTKSEQSDRSLIPPSIEFESKDEIECEEQALNITPASPVLESSIYRDGHGPCNHPVTVDQCEYPCSEGSGHNWQHHCSAPPGSIELFTITVLVPRKATSYCVPNQYTQTTEGPQVTQSWVDANRGLDVHSRCSQITGDPRVTPESVHDDNVQNHSPVTEDCAEEGHNSDIQVQATQPRILVKINEKLHFVFLTYGQKEDGDKVDKLFKKLIYQLEKYGINVVADRSCGLYCSKDLINGSVMKLERESCLETLQFFYEKATSVVVGITPGYRSYITSTVDGKPDQNEAEASNHRQQARHIYTLMLNEYKRNHSKNKRFYPVKVSSKSKKIDTVDKHIPEWMQSTLIYTYPGDKKQNQLFEHLKQDFKK